MLYKAPNEGVLQTPLKLCSRGIHEAPCLGSSWSCLKPLRKSFGKLCEAPCWGASWSPQAGEVCKSPLCKQPPSQMRIGVWLQVSLQFFSCLAWGWGVNLQKVAHNWMKCPDLQRKVLFASPPLWVGVREICQFTNSFSAKDWIKCLDLFFCKLIPYPNPTYARWEGLKTRLFCLSRYFIQFLQIYLVNSPPSQKRWGMTNMTFLWWLRHLIQFLAKRFL